jgi:FlaA1/EpsC-like NDP-sugar epimerase
MTVWGESRRQWRLPRRARHAYRMLVPHRYLIIAVLDMAALTVAIAAATVLRYDLEFGAVDYSGVLAAAAIACTVQFFAGTATGLYMGRSHYGSFEEVQGLVTCAVLDSIVLLVVNGLLPHRLVPLTAAVTGPLLGLAFMCGGRYAWRVAVDHRKRPSSDGAERIIVFGAGEGGTQVINALMRTKNTPYYPVALLDDDPRKRGRVINGVRCRGGRDRIAVAKEAANATQMLIAIPSAPSDLVRDLATAAETAGLEVKVLPPVQDLLAGTVSLNDIRPISEDDLLGRRQINTDVASIAGYLRNRRVLVTGAGGSIGAELCRQIHGFGPATLVMLDRDESALHAVQLSIHGRALLDTDDLVVCDVRDGEQIEQILATRQPDVVFHAAALKHLPLLERYPDEAVKTNVWGTLNVLRAAAHAGVTTFVNISTDKAADPASVLGYTKRIAERITAWANEAAQGTYLSVRFGNVLGSRGSVLTAFHAQIERGGPITVTDAEVTRYFMTVEEAVELTIQAGALGAAGEVLVLDMGLPVKIADVAKRLAAAAPSKVGIEYTGLRPGEKLHEVLLGEGELDHRPCHPLISHVPAPQMAPSELSCLSAATNNAELVEALHALVGNGSREVVVDLSDARLHADAD